MSIFNDILNLSVLWCSLQMMAKQPKKPAWWIEILAWQEPDDDDRWGEEITAPDLWSTVLRLRPRCRQLRLMSTLPKLDQTSAIWLLRHMATSIGFYWYKILASSKWRLNCTLGANGFGEQISTVNTGNCSLITFRLVATNPRCDQVRSNTHDTLWGSGICERCHCRHLMSWVAFKRRHAEIYEFASVKSSHSKRWILEDRKSNMSEYT